MIVIPCYNEGATIYELVRIVSEVDKVTVVSDGSTDRTSVLAADAGAKVVTCRENYGKSHALRLGIQATSDAEITILDGDLLGITADHVRELRSFDRHRYRMSAALIYGQKGLLSGQRHGFREHFLAPTTERFGYELQLNRLVEVDRIKWLHWPDVTHLLKTAKQGLIEGWINQGRMFWEVINES